MVVAIIGQAERAGGRVRDRQIKKRRENKQEERRGGDRREKRKKVKEREMFIRYCP